jgi:hypothetical protein
MASSQNVIRNNPLNFNALKDLALSITLLAVEEETRILKNVLSTPTGMVHLTAENFDDLVKRGIECSRMHCVVGIKAFKCSHVFCDFMFYLLLIDLKISPVFVALVFLSYFVEENDAKRTAKLKNLSPLC